MSNSNDSESMSKSSSNFSSTNNEGSSDVVVDEFLNDLLERPTSAEIRARNFLTDRKILDLFHFLIGHLLVDVPDDPIDYLHDLLDKCILFRSGLIEPPLLFDKRHIESLFQSLDPTSSGHISLDGYKIGMITLGICEFNHKPTQSQAGRVDKQTFVDEAGGGGKGVRPVYLRCSRGTVSWRYPRGALRVVLSGGSEGRSFRGCVKISGPARVYLEGKGTLRPIYSPGDGKHEALHRCFHSRGQLAALYVEADETAHGRSTVKLRYDLELATRQVKGNNAISSGRDNFAERDEEVECRPCSKEELAEAYCKSDLVARGTVSAVERRPDLEAAELVLRVTKTLRRVEENEDNEVDSADLRYQREVRVRVPTACDARHGQGEFVIMARRKLGDLALACAPRLEAWAEAVRELKSAPCFLRS